MPPAAVAADEVSTKCKQRLSVVCGHSLAASTAQIQVLSVAAITRFEGKTCLVTGGASGIGAAAAHLFASQGANVLLVDIDGAACEATAKSLNEAVGTTRVVPFVADVASEQDNKAMVEAAVHHFGAIDAVFANAGVLPPWAPVHESTVSSFETVLRINLVGPFLAIKCTSEQMKKQQSRGSIIVTTSIPGICFLINEAASIN